MTISGDVVWQKNRETINRDCGGLYDDPATIFRPTKVSFRPDGGYYLGDDASWRNEVLADNFAMRAQPERWRSGCFVHSHDARFETVGNIYVAEWVKTGRVTKLVRKW